MQVPEKLRKPLAVIAAALALALGGYATGRYATPDKVVTHETVRTETKTVVDTTAQQHVAELEAQIASLKRDTHREVVTITRPDHTVERHETDDVHVAQATQVTTQLVASVTATQHVTQDAMQTATITHEVDRARPDWRMGPMVGVDLRSGALDLGAVVERRIAGPLSVGVWGLSNAQGTAFQAGAMVTLEF